MAVTGVPGLGEESLAVTVAQMLAAGREGVIEVAVIVGVRDLGGGVLAGLRRGLSVVPVVEEVGARVRAETEGESRAVAGGSSPPSAAAGRRGGHG